jgi:hypothetical protein
LIVDGASEFEERGEGDAGARFVPQAAAEEGIQHPSGNSDDQTIGKPNQVMVTGQPPESPHEMNFLIAIGMMCVANPCRRR